MSKSYKAIDNDYLNAKRLKRQSATTVQQRNVVRYNKHIAMLKQGNEGVVTC